MASRVLIACALYGTFEPRGGQSASPPHLLAPRADRKYSQLVIARLQIFSATKIMKAIHYDLETTGQGVTHGWLVVKAMVVKTDHWAWRKRIFSRSCRLLILLSRATRWQKKLTWRHICHGLFQRFDIGSCRYLWKCYGGAGAQRHLSTCSAALQNVIVNFGQTAATSRRISCCLHSWLQPRRHSSCLISHKLNPISRASFERASIPLGPGDEWVAQPLVADWEQYTSSVVETKSYWTALVPAPLYIKGAFKKLSSIRYVQCRF